MLSSNAKESAVHSTRLNSEDLLLSVVVPTFKRPERLRSLLRAVTAQVGDVAYEVIVVDDGGGGIQDVVAEFRERLPLVVLTQTNSGPGRARNLGAGEARGTRLVFIDDDCVPEPDWLEQISTAHREAPDAAIGGTTVNLLTENPFSSASQILVDFLYLYFQREEGRNDSFLTTNNASVPRDGFWRSGGFDVGFERAAGEDREFFDRWRFQGREIVFRPAIVIGHSHWMELWSFAVQHFRYGEAARRFWLLKWDREGRRKQPKTRFFRELLLYPLRRHGFGSQAVVLSLLLVLSQISNAAGYLWARLKEPKGFSVEVALETLTPGSGSRPSEDN